MMRRYIIDRFGHPLVHPYHYSTSTAPRAVTDHVVHRDYLERFYVEKAAYEELEERVKTLESRVSNLLTDCLQLSPDGVNWDARGKRISNVSPGSLPTDASTLGKVCVFDEETSSLKCAGIKYFNTVEIENRVTSLEATTNSRGDRLNKIESEATLVGKRLNALVDSMPARDQRVSTVEQTASGFADRVQNLESSIASTDGGITAVSATASGLDNRVKILETGTTAREQRVSTLEQTANGTSTLVQSLTGTVTNIHSVVLNDCMRVRADGKWDGKDRTIANVALGDSMDEVSTMGQTCTYVADTTNFRCGTTHFDLVQNSSSTPVLCASWHGGKGGWSLMPYGGSNEIFPYWALRYSPGSVLDSNGNRVVWDEWKKEFTQYELSSLKTNVLYIHPPLE